MLNQVQHDAVYVKLNTTLDLIQNRIHEIRGYRVMMDFDLAEMYGVDTRSLKQAVKRNESRFPGDFMFELTRTEWASLISHFVISNRGGNRFLPATPRKAIGYLADKN